MFEKRVLFRIELVFNRDSKLGNPVFVVFLNLKRQLNESGPVLFGLDCLRFEHELGAFHLHEHVESQDRELRNEYSQVQQVPSLVLEHR